MAEFIHGLKLCEDFFFEEAKPLLDRYYPGLRYSAGLIGYGSDVLGYDDPVSVDHMWGPRFYLFLGREEIQLGDEIKEMFSVHLPYTYKGFSVNFTEPDPNDNGVRHAEYITEGKVSSLIHICCIYDFIEEYLGKADLDHLSSADWLAFSEHRLLALTSGKLFADGLNIEAIRSKIRFYPPQVRLYMLASNWSLIAEEQAFVKRCGEVGDDIGSRIITARIADRLMRLCFLYEETYAPYSKWYGTAFGHLPVPGEIGALLAAALKENDLEKREDALVEAQRLVAELHNTKGITENIDVEIRDYFGRKIKVIFADKLADAIMEKLSGTEFETMPLISTFSQVGNFSCLSDEEIHSERIKRFYLDK